jgi:hypothetical protein
MNRNWVGGAVITALIGAAWLWSWWSTPPAVAFENLKYIQMLRTAVSSRNNEWLSKVESAAHKLHDSGEMSSSELKHFDRLIAMARGGDWKGADLACLEFEKAQLGRRRAPPALADN